MGKRSGIIDHEADFIAAPLAVLDREIIRCETMRELASNGRARRSFESRLHWLSRIRSRHPELNSN